MSNNLGNGEILSFDSLNKDEKIKYIFYNALIYWSIKNN